MTASYAASPRALRDPARVLWAVAGACWVLSVVLAVTGAVALGSHDHVFESAAPWPARIAAFLLVWTVMLGAMMLPTTTAMARVFTVVSGRQPRPLPARAAFYAAYLVVWTGFAVVALAGDSLVHRAVDRSAWLSDHVGVVLAGALVLAGAFELSPLKDACLRACRSPVSMVGRLYRRGPGGGWRVGIAHALNCLGCCWALMLVMFATGVGSLLWMLGLTAVMTVEKTTRAGARLVRPVAFGFLGAGLVLGGLALL